MQFSNKRATPTGDVIKTSLPRAKLLAVDAETLQ